MKATPSTHSLEEMAPKRFAKKLIDVIDGDRISRAIVGKEASLEHDGCCLVQKSRTLVFPACAQEPVAAGIDQCVVGYLNQPQDFVKRAES
jgi:hypothetical protein